MIKIEQETALEKDPSSNAVLNVNRSDYLDFMSAYYARVQEKQTQNREINSRIDALEQDIGDIKLMLQQLLAK